MVRLSEDLGRGEGLRKTLSLSGLVEREGPGGASGGNCLLEGLSWAPEVHGWFSYRQELVSDSWKM